MFKKIALISSLTLVIIIAFSFSIIGLMKSRGGELPQEKQERLPVDKNEQGERTTSREDNTSLTLKEVLKHPSRYNGKKITIDCYYYSSFEKVVLASTVIIHKEGWRYVSDDGVWINWAINPPEDLFEKLIQIEIGLDGMPDLYGRVEVEGIFSLMKGVGHDGMYKYAFEIYKFRVYDESLGKFVPEK
jgi:hypothetical protein